jgi:hypothetical protein
MKKRDGFRYSPGAKKWVEVEEPVVPTRPSAKRRRLEKAYAQVGLKEAAAAFKANRAHKAFVWVWLQYEAWRTKSATVTLPNGELEQYGINRELKRRALRDYAEAGLLTINQRGTKSIVVTLKLSTIVDSDCLRS